LDSRGAKGEEEEVEEEEVAVFIEQYVSCSSQVDEEAPPFYRSTDIPRHAEKKRKLSADLAFPNLPWQELAFLNHCFQLRTRKQKQTIRKWKKSGAQRWH